MYLFIVTTAKGFFCKIRQHRKMKNATNDLIFSTRNELSYVKKRKY